MNEQYGDFEIPNCSACLHWFSGICLIGDMPDDLGCLHFKGEITQLSRDFYVGNEKKE